MRTGIINGEVNDLWAVVHDSGELTSSTNYVITGLEGDTDLEYFLIMRNTGNNNQYVVPNNDTSGTIYSSQYLAGGADDNYSSESSNANGWWGTYSNSLVSMHIFAKTGRERTCISTHVREVSGTDVGAILKRNQIWNNTVDELTQLNFVGSISAGTHFILLKKVHADKMKTGEITPTKIENTWDKIFSYTCEHSFAEQSLQIDNLEGDSDVVYKLIVRVSGYGSEDTLLQFNEDATDNYGYQYMRGADAVSSAYYALLQTSLPLTHTSNHYQCGFAECLIYAKSGTERLLHIDTVRDITSRYPTSGGENIIGDVTSYASSWANEIDEITSMSFSGFWRTGSTFELWRINL
jgi:hypothetical protein